LDIKVPPSTFLHSSASNLKPIWISDDDDLPSPGPSNQAVFFPHLGMKKEKEDKENCISFIILILILDLDPMKTVDPDESESDNDLPSPSKLVTYLSNLKMKKENETGIDYLLEKTEIDFNSFHGLDSKTTQSLNSNSAQVSNFKSSQALDSKLDKLSGSKSTQVLNFKSIQALGSKSTQLSDSKPIPLSDLNRINSRVPNRFKSRNLSHLNFSIPKSKSRRNQILMIPTR
jgi:hypothetical protein